MKRDERTGRSGLSSLAQLILVHFGWLQRDYHFLVLRTEENGVVFASRFCQVMVALEREDLFVELASSEPEPIRRIRFSLNELLAAKSVASEPRASHTGRVSASLDDRLRVAAALLAEHGGDVLAGDFTIRPRIVEAQVRAWLETKHQDVVEKRRYPTIQAGIRQVAWELSSQTEEKRAEARRQLDEWLSVGAATRRTFAEHVLTARGQ